MVGRGTGAAGVRQAEVWGVWQGSSSKLLKRRGNGGRPGSRTKDNGCWGREETLMYILSGCEDNGLVNAICSHLFLFHMLTWLPMFRFGCKRIRQHISWGSTSSATCTIVWVRALSLVRLRRNGLLSRWGLCHFPDALSIFMKILKVTPSVLKCCC